MTDLKTFAIAHQVDREVLDTVDTQTLVEALTAASRSQIRKLIEEYKAAN